MKQYYDKYANLPLPFRAAITLGVFLVIVGGFWQFVYKDLSVKKNELLQQIEDNEDRILAQRKVARNLGKYQEEVTDLDRKFESVLRELPDEKEIERFLRSISVLAIDTGLEVIEFTPQGEVKEGFFGRLPVKIKLEGSFHQLATFFDEVGHLPRIVNIDGISIEVVNENPNEVIISAECQATTFRYLDSDERPRDEGDGKRRRRRSA